MEHLIASLVVLIQEDYKSYRPHLREKHFFLRLAKYLFQDSSGWKDRWSLYLKAQPAPGYRSGLEKGFYFS